MNRKKIGLVLNALANVAASFPIFVVGGSFIFAGNISAYFGVASMSYAVFSCALLFFTLANPTRAVLIVDRVAIGLLLIVALWLFAVRQDYDYGLLFAVGSALIFATKWWSHTYVYRYQTGGK